jgi:hypothetical protein
VQFRSTLVREIVIMGRPRGGSMIAQHPVDRDTTSSRPAPPVQVLIASPADDRFVTPRGKLLAED